ncbi:MAG: hypothetical protein HY673_21150 [Chloroflexi bacterium]|nr:hypothetical protein [Chloroflexota bacterium]
MGKKFAKVISSIWLAAVLVVQPGFPEGTSGLEAVAAVARYAPTKLDAGLSALLYRMRIGDIRPGTEVDSIVKEAEKLGGIAVYLRALNKLGPEQLAAIESLGAKLGRGRDGSVSNLGNIYSARISLNKLQQLADLPFIHTLSTPEWPKPRPALNTSVPDTRGDLLWRMKDNSSNYLTGQGVKVANHDTGIDQFHPDFWRNNPADPQQAPRQWTDRGAAGYNPGEDVVVGYENEGTLNHINTTGNQAFEWKIDFLYIDRGNQGQVGARDFGEGSGFTESTPSYGEKLFMVEDTNNNGVFDVNDRLIPLWTSKIYASYYRPDWQSVPVRRYRGIDLIRAARDPDGHGTETTGVMASGAVGKGRTYVGMAPDADYIVGSWFKNAPGVDLFTF